MSEKEYKNKCESMFKKNVILINENERLTKELAESKAHIKTLQQDLKNMTKRCKDYEISTCKGCIYTELETDNEHCNHCYAGSRKNVS